MKVGKEEIVGLLVAVELFMSHREEDVIAQWEQRCRVIAAAADGVPGVTARYHPPFSHRFPPASPLVDLEFGPQAPRAAREVLRELEAGDPAVWASGSDNSVRFGPQTLQDGEAEVIAARLAQILRAP